MTNQIHRCHCLSHTSVPQSLRTQTTGDYIPPESTRFSEVKLSRSLSRDQTSSGLVICPTSVLDPAPLPSRRLYDTTLASRLIKARLEHDIYISPRALRRRSRILFKTGTRWRYESRTPSFSFAASRSCLSPSSLHIRVFQADTGNAKRAHVPVSTRHQNIEPLATHFGHSGKERPRRSAAMSSKACIRKTSLLTFLFRTWW